ncbi:hypothetical protein QCE62_22825 [Caballeronia sp. LZ033]|uniref:hypothetical protein n=1 Tax=Caballeronia sp. LZ033 TaxID=3038566 RepID=UPI00285DC6D9|nr:hypothetical protein [Caballeronia sp. LZ033]MDR5816429.1 hypothetical protein [Caballeronia sp. LZ033]
MSDISHLMNKLVPFGASERFRLDGRSDERVLQQLKDYASLIPFDASHSWADVLFTAGVTPASLAEIFSQPKKADGELGPQQAFILAFMQMLKTPRALLNALPYAHREMYYRDLLGLTEASARADSVALGFALAKSARECFLSAGTLFDAGEIDGVKLSYALDRSLLVNPGVWTDLRWKIPGDGSAALTCIAFDQTQGEWNADGVRLFDPEATQTPMFEGRLVASGALAAPAGKRTFKVTFEKAVDEKVVASAEVSGENGWLPLSFSSLSSDKLTMTWWLGDDQPAIVAPEDLDGLTFDTAVLRLGNESGAQVPAVTKLSLVVEGDSALAYGTDNGAAPLDGASYPFGTLPVTGAGFNLIAPDWCGQAAAATLTVTPRWVGLPAAGFATWYTGYDSPPASNTDFKVQALLMSGVQRVLLSSSPSDATKTAPQSLFTGAGNVLPVAAALTVAVPAELAALSEATSNPTDWPRWIRFELTGRDFGHQVYQKLAGSKTLNPPYTPQMNGVAIEWKMDVTDFAQYVLTPFGYDGSPDAGSREASQACLYLGFTDGTPGETITLYWELDSPQAVEPEWHYLNQQNDWVSLADTLVDGTNGLRDSGIMNVILPHDASDSAAQMPPGRYWLRALVAKPMLDMSGAKVEGDADPLTEPAVQASTDADTDSTPKHEPDYAYVWLKGILANGMTASLHSPESVPASHFLAPLAASTITRPVEPVAELSPVVQPWPSSGGKAAETPVQFMSRSAERLFHRSRALTWHDMGSLIKARFDNVFEVAIPPVDNITDLPAPDPLNLLIVPITERKDNDDPLRPRLSQSHLNAIQAYVQGMASTWARIAVVNPTYRDVLITYDISFNVNPDYGYCQIQEQLERRYMPWMQGGQSGLTLGTTLDFYGMVAFIEAQPFVTEVVNMTLDGGWASIHAATNEVLILTWKSATQTMPAVANHGRRNNAVEA